MNTKTYAVLGTGALGGYYGGLLARAGFETHFLLRSDFEHVRDHGLRVDSKNGDFHVPPEQLHAHGDPADLPAVDVAVVALKTTSNGLLPGLLASCVKPDGVVLVLQNGYAPEADAAAVVGPERVLGGLCFLCSNKVGPGHIDHQDYGHVHVGRYTDEPGPAEAHFPGVVEEFRGAGIDATAIDDLRLSRWKKLVWNVPYNGLSVVLGQKTDELMRDPASRRRVEALMHEVQAAAAAADGRTIDDAFVAQMLDYTAKMRPYQPSMMLDHEAGRPLEVASIVGDPLRAGRAVGCDLPEMGRLYDELRSA
ncbi:MAG: putative 2-dehydropantoate 2-reductase [Planctomycetota bacterium]